MIRIEYGGSASLNFLDNLNEPPYETNYYLNIERKRAIALAVVGMINPEETIILDSGTTNLQIASPCENQSEGSIAHTRTQSGLLCT